MSDFHIKKGDKCWVQGRKKHYGVCVGHDIYRRPEFVHNTLAGGVVYTDRQGFGGNRPITVEQHAPAGRADEVVARAWALVGKEYNLFLFNCEHVASLALTGKAESPQLQTGVGLSLLGLFVLALVNNNGTSVDYNGYRRNSSGQFATRRWV